jgi:hypothetical protein
MLRKYILLLPILFATACLEESTTALDEKAFTKIYDNDQFDASYYPIDMRQTADGGYLMLGGRRLDNTNFSGIYLLKADRYGNFVRELEVDESFVNPIAQLVSAGTSFKFFCMDPLTLEAYLATVDENLEGVTMAPLDLILTYPAAAAPDGTNLLLLSYNALDKESVISLMSATGSVSQSKGYSIGAGDAVEEPLINHFLRTGQQFPFQVGRIPGGLYYFNGFYNYTFSLAFTNLTQDDPNGVVQGQQNDGGFSAVLPITGSTFATSTFNFGDNSIIPNAVLNTSGITSSVDLEGNNLPELESNATVKIIRATINGKNVLVYGSNTKSKQIGLYFYDEASGEFLDSEYIGYSNPFEIATVIQTTEGDLAVSGTTYVAGRLPRFCLIKISKSSLKGI